jgi:hypothetical protein
VSLRSALLMVVGTGLLALSAMSCLGADATATQVYACPDKSSFTGLPAAGGAAMPGVSAYMERRCGTLDCHGSFEIPMRLHGQLGRRDPTEGNIPGGALTTTAELEANYGAVCSVEPEKTSEQVSDFGQSAEDLLIVRKARGIEGHKGGTVVKQGDAADKCIVSWLRGRPLTEISPVCQEAIDKLD